MTAEQVAFAEAAGLPLLDDEGQRLVQELKEIRKQRDELGLLEREKEDALTAWMAERGLWQTAEVTRHGGTKRQQWKHDEVLDALRRYAQANPFHPETGEKVDPGTALSWAIVACAGIGYWRSGSLKKFGLDPDEFATRVEGRQSVTLR